jgi:hypothetical protein
MSHESFRILNVPWAIYNSKCPMGELEFISGRRGASMRGNYKINPFL